MNNREIDALVAEAMGWTWYTDPETGDKALVATEASAGLLGFYFNSYWPTRSDSHEMPHYTTDDAAAVDGPLKKLLARTPTEDIHIQHLSSTGWGISSCYEAEEDMWDGWIYAETLALAICLAFLAAMGVEVPTPTTPPQ